MAVYTYALVLVAVAAAVTSADTTKNLGLTNLEECSSTYTRRHLYVATMDGKVTSLDQDGYMLWEYNMPHTLFSSTLRRQESNQGTPNLIPGLDGELYQWDGTTMKRLKAAAGDLLDAKSSYNEGMVLVGSREWEVIAVNTGDGEPLYECSRLKCQRFNRSVITLTSILKISTHRVTMREIDEFTGDELWNFTMSELALSLTSKGVAQLPCSAINWHLHVDGQTGDLAAVRSLSNGTSAPLWKYKLSAPAVGVWLHEGSCLHKLQLSSNLPFKEALLLVSYHSMPYLQPITAESFFHLHPPIIPFTVTKVPILTSTIVHTLGARRKELSLYRGDYHGNSESSELCTEEANGLVPFYHGLLQDTCYDEKSQNWSHEQALAETNHSQRSMLGSFMNSTTYTGLTYILFIVVMVMMDRLHKFGKQAPGRTLSVTIEDDECGQQPPEQCACDTPATPLVTSQNPCRLFAIPEEHTDFPIRKESMNMNESRFGLDYELKGQLGKGGFGVVYHVRSRTDGGEYAVKRIRLPIQKSARDKVMREVLVLARLEHPRIVRYYHSWVEKAPQGWNEMEEWASLSRRNSYIASEQSSMLSTGNMSASLMTSSRSSSPNHNFIHSGLPAQSDNSSSCGIEFRDDTCKSGTPGETDRCFSQDLMMDRDDLSDESLHSKQKDGALVHAMATEPPTCLFIQMQLCRKDTLRDWLNTNVTNRSRKEAMHFFEQVLDAVGYIHGRSMIHRDLKPSNIFFSLDGNVKVGDFGLVACNAAEVVHSSYVALKSIQEDYKHTGNIGSHFYMSPEQTNAMKYNEKVDIFALGVIFFELHHPFRTEMERVKVLEDLKKYMFPQSFKNAAPTVIEFTEWLMARNPGGRPSAKEIASSNLFAELRILTSSTLLALEP